MQQRIHLILQSRLVCLVAVSERTHRNTSGKIKVFLSVRVIQIHALTVVKHQRETVVGMQQAALGSIYVITFIHCRIYPPDLLR